MTYLKLIIIILYIVWSICSIVIILTKPKDIFKENLFGEDLTPFTNAWILITGIVLVSFLIMLADSTKVFWEK